MLFNRFRVSSRGESYSTRGSVPQSSMRRRSPIGSIQVNDDNNDLVAPMVGIQVFGTAIGLGLWTNSWWVFGISLLGLIFLFHCPRVALVLGIIYSVCLAVVVGKLVFSEVKRYDAGIVSGTLAFALFLSLNLEHVRRLST